MCVTVAVSSRGSSSSAAETVTVCAVAQFEVENVRLAGFAETSVLSVGFVDGDRHGGRGPGVQHDGVRVRAALVDHQRRGRDRHPRVSSSVTVTVRLTLLTEP